MTRNVLEKVTAFVTRSGPTGQELLLFRHPHAGIQLPAGTVEEGETPEQAVLREAMEETGLSNLRLGSLLGRHEQALPENFHAVLRSTTVYSRADPMGFDWARICARVLGAPGTKSGRLCPGDLRRMGSLARTQLGDLPHHRLGTGGRVGKMQRRTYFHLTVRRRRAGWGVDRTDRQPSLPALLGAAGRPPSAGRATERMAGARLGRLAGRARLSQSRGLAIPVLLGRAVSLPEAVYPMRQPAQMKKDQVIAELIAARREVLDAASALLRLSRDTVFLGVWTVKDLLAHLVGWDQAGLGIEANPGRPATGVLCPVRARLARA